MKKKVVSIWLSALLIVFCAIAFVLQVKELIKSFNEQQPYVVINILLYALALITAVFYCVYGYKKSERDLYFLTTFFMLLTAVSAVLVNVINSDVLSAAVNVTACCCVSVLAFAKDLGKKKSFVFAGIVAAMCILNTIIGAVRFGTEDLLSSAFKNVSIAAVYLIMVYAKYVDKESRGSK